MDGQGEVASATICKLKVMSIKDKIDKQDAKEDESINLNIEQINREGDLSSKQIENFKGKAKKGTKIICPNHR